MPIHENRIKLAVMALTIALPSLVVQSATAGPIYGSESVTLQIVNTTQGQFTESPKIEVALPANSGFASSTLFTLDTGSTGVAVSAPIWDPTAVGATLLGSGSLTYSSSGRILNGDWYHATLQIGGGNATAQSLVPVLFVTSIDCLPKARDCKQDPNPKNVSFFGVGFAREADSQATTPSGTVASIPAYNPLLNITALNGVSVVASTPSQPGSSGVIGNFGSGYILTPEGLTLGLTAANTSGFATLNLTWNDQTNASGFYSGYADWNPVPVTATVNGTSGLGTVLTDTGIKYMIVTPPPGTVLHTDKACPSQKHCLAAGTRISVNIGDIVSYAFTIGKNDGAPTQPTSNAAPDYEVKADGTDVFVNTGYHFFNQYNYLYDYVNGQIGYSSRSVPGPLPLAGAAHAFFLSRRLRRRRSAGQALGSLQQDRD